MRMRPQEVETHKVATYILPVLSIYLTTGTSQTTILVVYVGRWEIVGLNYICSQAV
jgi:hypothetical protein